MELVSYLRYLHFLGPYNAPFNCEHGRSPVITGRREPAWLLRKQKTGRPRTVNWNGLLCGQDLDNVCALNFSWLSCIESLIPIHQAEGHFPALNEIGSRELGSRFGQRYLFGFSYFHLRRAHFWNITAIFDSVRHLFWTMLRLVPG